MEKPSDKIMEKSSDKTPVESADESADLLTEKKLLTRKSSGSISSPPSVTGSPRHHRGPRRAASERRRSRHHHHHHLERKGSLYATTSSHHGHSGVHGAGLEGRRTSRVGDRRVSHSLGEGINPPSRTNSISDHRKLSNVDPSSLPVPQRKAAERTPSNGPYMSPGLNMGGGYRTPGAEILIASLIIAVGLVALIVSFSTGQKIWLMVGSVCMALGGMFLILGICWYCAKAKEKPPEESRELRVVTNEEIRAKLLHHHSSVKNGQGPHNV